MKHALIVIDMQNDFISGSLGSRDAEAITEGVVKAIKAFEGDIFVTLDTHGEDYMQTAEGKKLPVPHCIRDTEGWAHPREIAQALAEKSPITVLKETFGSMALPQILRAHGYTDGDCEMTLVGLCTDICVVSNAMILKAAFPQSRVALDATRCAGTSKEAHDAAIRVMQSCQIEILNGLEE